MTQHTLYKGETTRTRPPSLTMKLLHCTKWAGNSIKPGNDRDVGSGYIWTQYVHQYLCCKRFGSRIIEMDSEQLSQFSSKWKFYFVNQTDTDYHTFYKYLLTSATLPQPRGAILLNELSSWDTEEIFYKIGETLREMNNLPEYRTHVHIGVHTNGIEWNTTLVNKQNFYEIDDYDYDYYDPLEDDIIGEI